jgi:hypothetical protein
VPSQLFRSCAQAAPMGSRRLCRCEIEPCQQEISFKEVKAKQY